MKWQLIAEHDRCFTIDGRHGEIDKANFDSPQQLEAVLSFKNMLYGGIEHDFMQQPERQVAYKITYRLEKLEGGFFE